MGKIIEKLDPYELMTSFLPGAFFCLMLKAFYGLEFFNNASGIEEVAVYYFAGLIVNRIGSVIVKPSLLKMKFIKESVYNEYVEAEKKDPKIKTLVEICNYYRSMLTSCMMLVIVRFVIVVHEHIQWMHIYWKNLVLLGIIMLFLFSYKKQTEFVCKRVEN